MTIDAFFYFAILALWSGIVAYYILFVVLGGKGKKAPHATHHASKTHAAPTHHAPAHHAPAKPVARGRFSPHEGFKSFARDVEVTVEDIVHGLARGD